MSRARPVLVLFGASLLWGASWLPLKALHRMGLEAVPLTAATYGLLALLLTPLLLGQRRLWRGSGHHLLLIALLGGGANLAFTYALLNGDVVRVTVLFYLLPVWGVLGGRLVLGERIDTWRWFGVVLAVGGAFLILGGFRVLAAPPSWLDLAALLSGLLFAMNNLVFRVAHEVPVASKIAAMFHGCAALALLLLAVGAQPWPMAASGTAWVALGAYAVAWLLVANLGTQWGVTQLEAGRASIIIIMELITAVASATLLGGETLSAPEIFGGLLILTAALIEALRADDDDLVAHAGA